MAAENPVRNIYFGGPIIKKEEKSAGASPLIAFGGVICLLEDPQQFLTQVQNRQRWLDKSSPLEVLSTQAINLRNKVSTDEIITVDDLLTTHVEDLGDRALCGLPSDYRMERKTLRGLYGTVLVAGEQFGKGSSREQAVEALLQAGITGVLAPSFGPIFARNAAYLGLLTSTNLAIADQIQRGESVPLSEFTQGKDQLLQQIVSAGDLFNYFRKEKDNPPNIPERPASKPMNVWEKRLSRILGANCVQAGDITFLPVDEACSYVVLSGTARRVLQAEYGTTMTAKVMPTFFEDHFAYSNKPGVIELTEEQRLFAQELDVPEEKYHFGRKSKGGGVGIIHRYMLENIDPRQTKVVIITDSHTPTLGALPIASLPVGSTEFALGIAEGKIPFSVQSVLRVELAGHLPPGTTVRDAQLEIAANYARLLNSKQVSGAKVVEFGGAGLDTLTFSQVAALGNMVPEVFNAEIAVTEAFQAGIEYLQYKYGISEDEARSLYGTPDLQCQYSDTYQFDLSKTTPWIALPSDPANGRPISILSEHPAVHKAYIASCTNGLDELKEAAAVLLDQQVAANTQLIIIPSSQAVYDEAERRGYLQILRDAGAIVRDEIACSACIGDGKDAVLPRETAISATNRNFRGRMDPSKQGEVYLAGSILTVLSAQFGQIPTSQQYQNEVGRIVNNLQKLN